MVTRHSPDIQDNLRTHKLILDTSFAMQPAFGRFLVENAQLFQENNILVPLLVIRELEKLTSHSDSAKRASASSALRQVRDLIQNSMAEVRYEASDTFVDHVIQRVVEQHMLTWDILVLTNDAPLMRDIRAKLRKESVRTSKSLRVVKLHRGTGQPVEFYPRPDGPHQRNVPRHPAPMPPFEKHCEMFHGDTPITVHSELGAGSILRLSDGSTVTLGNRIAQGGEGAIFELIGRDDVCKIYRRDKVTKAKEEKIRLMLTRRVTVPGICWPVDTLRELHGTFRGYTMPRAHGQPLGHSLFIPKLFLAGRPAWTRRDSVQLALSILQLISALHEMNVLIGDVNPQNILFTDAKNVWIVDCDSFQVEGFPCPVGTVNFSAPEIQGKDFRTFLRTEEHELFAIATLMFMIMFPGKSPYSHAGGEDGAANIRKMEFPYTRDRSNATRRAPSGVWTYCWSHLTMHLKDAFSHSFSRESITQARVPVADWIDLFSAYARILRNENRVFMGPKPNIGFDLSIMPHSHRFTEQQADKLPRDGKSDYERLLNSMVRAAQISSPSPQPTPTAASTPRQTRPSPGVGQAAPSSPLRSSPPPTTASSRTAARSVNSSAGASQSSAGCFSALMILGTALIVLILG